MRTVPRSRYLVFFSIAIVGCATDLATKSWIFGRQGMYAPRAEWIVDNFLGLRTTMNEGALFGMGPGWTPLFAGLALFAAIGVLVWLFWVGAARDWLLTIALGCVLGGIVGNLYDRLGLHGLKWPDTNAYHQVGDRAQAVRDWILVMIGSYEWPTFNVADSLLCIGAALLVWHAFTSQPPKVSDATESPSG